jgi:hypothetical protein
MEQPTFLERESERMWKFQRLQNLNLVSATASIGIGRGLAPRLRTSTSPPASASAARAVGTCFWIFYPPFYSL